MSLLAIGLVLFLAIHLIPSAPRLRTALVARLGEKLYRSVFSVVVLLSLVAVVWGFSRAPLEAVYTPPSWGHRTSMVLVPVALVFFAAANMPTHIRAAVRHPMMLGLLLWALAHMIANGEARSVVLFGGFALFAVVETISAVVRGKNPPPKPMPRIKLDLAAVVSGLVAAGLLAVYHGALFGVPVL